MRPTNWSLELEEEAWRYIDNYTEHGHAIPSIVGLCKVLGRARSTLYDWAEDESKSFSDILAAINENQELVTLNKSITGEFSAPIAKLVLGKQGYHDKQDATVASPDGGPVTMIERIIVKAPDRNG